MSPSQKREAEERARAFIDKIVAINRKYGMDGNLAEDVYNDAVTSAANAYRGLVRDREPVQSKS
jgi:hypothetical protein